MTKREKQPHRPHEVKYDVSTLTEDDVYLFNEGNHFHLFEKLGAHPMVRKGAHGTHFAVWAPDAVSVTIVGDFNGWNRESHPLHPRGSSGIWEGFIPGIGKGDVYKYFIRSRFSDLALEKADPFAAHAEVPPKSASVVWTSEHTWNDDEWMKTRAARNALDAPMSIYEMHIGSWRFTSEAGEERPLTYRELAEQLPDYLNGLGFTHVEFLPVMEHPFGGSWGYQVTGLFAPTSRFGTPDDFRVLVDCLHQRGIGVILDWVPSHFATDGHGLGLFDGTHLFEHADSRQGFHPDWGSFIFNYGRTEVRSFLISSAMHWLEEFHADGLRVDAVASMLYLDYSREDGEWIPNIYGGRENLEAIGFLRRLNEAIYQHHPDVQTIAEESTDWPAVSRPLYVGGLGFGLKWDMGWMHDTLRYMSKDPVHRKYHHNDLTFRMLYAWHENFALPLSHDEVVHGKGSLIGKMPGDWWQQFANMRLLLASQWAQPGKKLLFMGGEFAQFREWNHKASLDWNLLDWPQHRGISQLVSDLNHLMRSEPALHELDFDPRGFQWIDCNDWENSIVSMMRAGHSTDSVLVMVFNYTPVPRHGYRVGVPHPGFYREMLNTDSAIYGGGNVGNAGGVSSDPVPWMGRAQSVTLTVPPLAAVFLRWDGTGASPSAGQ